MTSLELHMTTEVIGELLWIAEHVRWNDPTPMQRARTLLSYLQSQEQCCPSEATSVE